MNSTLSKIVSYTKQELVREINYLERASKPKKILFDHLPKCGGSSLNYYLAKHYPRRKTFSLNGADPESSVKKFINKSQRERFSYDLIKGHLAHELLDYAPHACIKVTVLRDPVERIVSHYYYAKSTPKHYLYSKIHDANMNLEDYVSSNIGGELHNWYTTHFTGLSVEEVQSNQVNSLENAHEVIKKYDIVGFLDKYADFINKLQNKANLRYSYSDKKINVTCKKPLLKEIPKDTLKLIHDANIVDIKLYNRLRNHPSV